jgi:hypothetical protein
MGKFNEDVWIKAINNAKIKKPRLLKRSIINTQLHSPEITFVKEDDYVFIKEKKNIEALIYSLKQKKIIAKLCKKGEGPGETRWIKDLVYHNNQVFVAGSTKILIYSLVGKLVMELPFPANCNPKPFGTNYISKKPDLQSTNLAHDWYSYINIVLLDKSFDVERILYSGRIRRSMNFDKKTMRRNMLYFSGCLRAISYKEKLVIGDSEKGFHFKIFDHGGELLYEINRPYLKRKVTNIEKEKIMKDQKKNKRLRRYNVKFFDTYPAFGNFTVDGSMIYVIIHPENGYYTIIIMNLSGDLKNVIKIPIKYFPDDYIYRNPIISNGSLFYLKDDYETNQWAIFSINIH